MDKFSVLMSVYKNTKADELRECMDSLLSQTVQASEYVMVVDGVIGGELQAAVEDLQNRIPTLVTVCLEQNRGLGLALREGMKHCSNELVARMDTDDIAVSDRFEKQLACFAADEELSIVGSNIAEFQGGVDHIVSRRHVPEQHDAICKFLKERCPFNHMTVMFRRSEVEKSGGYLDWHYNEDSYLWVRMYLAGCRFYNIPEELVLARINADTFRRRGGYRYYRSERDLFRFMRKKGIIGFWEYRMAKWKRFVVYVLMPNGMREWAFKKFVRESSECGK